MRAATPTCRPGPENQCRCRASRRWVWIAAGLGVLLPGLLMVYLPAMRRPPVLLVLGLALAATACFYPEPALIAGPFALVGGLALATARTVQWGLERRREGVVRGASRSSTAPRSTPRGQPAPEGSRDTTATAAGNLPLSGVGSHSG